MQNAYKILKALFDSGSDPRVRQEVRRWFFRNPGRERKDEALRMVWDEQIRRASKPDFQVIQRYVSLCQRLGIPVPEARYRMARTHRHRILHRATAAAAVLAIGVAGFTLYRYADMFTNRLAVERTESSVAGQSPRMITLACGSSVWLRGDSRIALTRSPREVILEGEACFDIEPNGKPFVVHTGQIQVKVLGTVFCVNNAANLDRMTVDLYSGAVELKAFSDRILLEKGKRFVLEKQREHWEIEDMARNIGYPDWVQSSMMSAGGIAFDDILQIIADAYGLEAVNNRPDLGRDKYFFTLTDDMQIEEAMNTLRLLNNDFTYRIEDHKLIID